MDLLKFNTMEPWVGWFEILLHCCYIVTSSHPQPLKMGFLPIWRPYFWWAETINGFQSLPCFMEVQNRWPSGEVKNLSYVPVWVSIWFVCSPTGPLLGEFRMQFCYILYMYMLCYCNYISHLHFKQKIKVTTSFIWLRIRMDTIPLSLQWVASLRQIVLAITSGALNEIHGAGTVVWFVLWKAPGWEQVNYAYTSSYIYIYVCIHVYVYMYICMYIYTHVYTRR